MSQAPEHRAGNHHMIGLPIVLASSLGLASPAEPAVEPTPSFPSMAATLAAIQAEEEEAPDGLWHGNLNVGLSRTEGNADVENYSIDFRAVRDYNQHRYTAEALWYMARDNNNNAQSFLQRRALGSIKYDQFFSPTSRKTYFWLNGLMETNFAAGIDLRWTVGAGIGHQWRDDDVWKVNTEVGLAHFDEEFDQPIGGVQGQDYLAARVAWDVWHQLTETVQFGHVGELFPSLDDKDDLYGRANTFVETKLSENMVARLSWILVYDNTPGINPLTGGRAEKADNIYTLTVGWKF